MSLDETRAPMHPIVLPKEVDAGSQKRLSKKWKLTFGVFGLNVVIGTSGARPVRVCRDQANSEGVMKKSRFAFAAVAGLAAIAAVPLGVSAAKAQLGSVSIEGIDVTNFSPNTIAFNPFGQDGLARGVARVTVSMGNLAAPLPVSTNVGMIGGGLPPGVNFTVPGEWIGQKLFGSTPEDFIISTFTSAIVGTSLDLSGTGTFSGIVNTPGFWTLTTQVDADGLPNTTTFSAQAVSVPGPIVGAGLPGLIAALGGLVALARRRCKQLA